MLGLQVSDLQASTCLICAPLHGKSLHNLQKLHPFINKVFLLLEQEVGFIQKDMFFQHQTILLFEYSFIFIEKLDSLTPAFFDFVLEVFE